MTDEITKKAVLVSLNISAWSARKYDKQVTAEVLDAHHAETKAGRFTKALLPADATSYKSLSQAIGQARTIFYANTLAWNDDGWRLLPMTNYLTFTDRMREAGASIDTALQTFLNAYPALRAAAKSALNGLYKDDDYPSVDALASKFSHALNFRPFPAAEDFRITLADAEKAAIQASCEASVKASLEAAQADMRTRLMAVLGHMVEKLSDSKAIFRDSLITNARDLAEALQTLNFTADADIERYRVALDRLATVEPDTLRTHADVRSQVAQQAQTILADMTSIFGGSQQ